jgi:hypothetical protein
MPDQNIRQFLGDFGGEEGRVGIGKLLALTRDRFDDGGVLVAKTGYRGAAGTIENFPSIGADEPHAMAADRDSRRLAQASVKNAAASGSCRFSRNYIHGIDALSEAI